MTYMKTFERHAIRRQMRRQGREKRKKAGFGLWFVCFLLHLNDLETIVGAGHFHSAHDEGDDEREITAGSEEKKGGGDELGGVPDVLMRSAQKRHD